MRQRHPAVHHRRYLDRVAPRQCARGGRGPGENRAAGRSPGPRLPEAQLRRAGDLREPGNRPGYAPPAGPRADREPRRRPQAGDVCELQDRHERALRVARGARRRRGL